MQNTRTMGRSPTGGLDNILRFDKLSIAGVRVFKPGEDEDNPWVPVKSLHTPILNVEKESPVDEYETKVAREISGGGADVSYDDGGEASQITTSCEGPPDGALRDDQHSTTDEEGDLALQSPCPTQGGGEDGVRNTVLHEGSVGVNVVANEVDRKPRPPVLAGPQFCSLARPASEWCCYDRLQELVKKPHSIDTGQEIFENHKADSDMESMQMFKYFTLIENTTTDSEMNHGAAFFGWCSI